MLVRAKTKHCAVQRSIGIYLVTGLTASGLTDGCFFYISSTLIKKLRSDPRRSDRVPVFIFYKNAILRSSKENNSHSIAVISGSSSKNLFSSQILHVREKNLKYIQ
jgi:hypothetical protein